MGHNRLRRLAKTHRWLEVVQLLDGPTIATEEVAEAVVAAAERRLRVLANDPALGYAVWLLTRVTWAARSDAFQAELARLGIPVAADASALTVVAAIRQHHEREAVSYGSYDDLQRLTTYALTDALTETVASSGPTLFGSTFEDTQRAFRTFSTRDRFGELARRFFAAFMRRTLRTFVERELANHVGSGRALNSAQAASDFGAALDRHVWQTSRIVEDFAGGWYSKRNWETTGQVSGQDAQAFSAVALRKLRTDLRIAERPQ